MQQISKWMQTLINQELSATSVLLGVLRVTAQMHVGRPIKALEIKQNVHTGPSTL